MNGIVTGKVEKSAGTVEFKTVKKWQVPASNSYWFKDATSFQKSEYVKITDVPNEKGKQHITLFYLPSIAPQTRGYSLWYGGFATDGLNIYYADVNNGLYLAAGYGNLTRYLTSIEIGTLS